MYSDFDLIGTVLIKIALKSRVYVNQMVENSSIKLMISIHFRWRDCDNCEISVEIFQLTVDHQPSSSTLFAYLAQNRPSSSMDNSNYRCIRNRETDWIHHWPLLSCNQHQVENQYSMDRLYRKVRAPNDLWKMEMKEIIFNTIHVQLSLASSTCV